MSLHFFKYFQFPIGGYTEKLEIFEKMKKMKKTKKRAKLKAAECRLGQGFPIFSLDLFPFVNRLELLNLGSLQVQIF